MFFEAQSGNRTVQLGPGGLIRSKSGCMTCRIRHVKCDETKPYCNRCQKTGRKCDGYNKIRSPPVKVTPSRSTPSQSLPHALPALPNFDDSRQRECFAFFVHCTSNASNVYLGANFWARRVLQLSLSEPSIRYALCSLSALHRVVRDSALSDPHTSASELQSYALLQYSHAVQRTQTLLAESSDGAEDKLLIGLVACALFVCYENFIGNPQLSHMHLKNGLQIIARERCRQRSSTVPKDIVQVFKRLDLQALTYSNSKDPYSDEFYHQPIELVIEAPTDFTSLEDSMDVVLHLCRWWFRAASHSESCPIPPSDLEAASNIIAKWNVDAGTFLATSTKSKIETQPHLALLKMYQIIMSIIVSTGKDRQETLHDQHLHKYRQVIALAESQDLSRAHFFCFDVGVIFPLFWTAVKCRDPNVRRRAVNMLASMNHQEGAWKSSSAAKVAEFVIGIEEGGVQIGRQEQVPEMKRVCLINMMADDERGGITVECLVRGNGEGESSTRQGWVSLPKSLKV